VNEEALPTGGLLRLNKKKRKKNIFAVIYHNKTMLSCSTISFADTLEMLHNDQLKEDM